MHLTIPFTINRKLPAILVLCAIPLLFQISKNYILSSRGWHVYEIQYSTIEWIVRLTLIPFIFLTAVKRRSLFIHAGGAILFTAIHIAISMILCLQTSSPDKRLWNLFNIVKNDALITDLTIYTLIVLIYYVWVSHEKSQQPRIADNLTIKSGQRTSVVKVKDIFSIEAEGHYVKVVTATSSNLMTISMKDIQNMLPSEFVRIHRSTIVNTSHITQTRSLMNGDYMATMKTGDQHKISRTYRDNLRAVLGNF